MKAIGVLRLAVLLGCVAMAREAAGAPLVMRADPTEFDASRNEGMRVVLIRGYDIWVGPTGYDEYARRTKVFMRRDGAFQEVRTYAHGFWTGTDQQELTLNVPTDPWFNSPGVFEVMVKVDDVASNYYQVPVLAGPPVIRKADPTRFTLSDARDQEREVRLVVDNLGNPLATSVLLDGKPLRWYHLGPGVLTTFIPESVYRDPGTFGLEVKSSVGASAAQQIELVRPPLRADSGRQAGAAVAQTPRGGAAPGLSGGASTVEGEELVAGARASAGAVSRQAMGAFGAAWSGGAQMLWAAPAPGATLTLTLNAPAAGRYDLAAYLTRAPDYGIVQAVLDGQPMGQPYDAYAGAVGLSDRVRLGTADLKAGANALVLKVTGKTLLSKGYLVGVDRIELTPAPPRGRSATVAPVGRLRTVE